jgi:hypothetical protein
MKFKELKPADQLIIRKEMEQAKTLDALVIATGRHIDLKSIKLGMMSQAIVVNHILNGNPEIK